MKNLSLIRRFITGSMILGLVVPMIYHISLNISRYSQFSSFTKDVCKTIEPRIQISAQRDSLEYLISAVNNKGGDAAPKVEFKDHGSLVTPPIEAKEAMARESCKFQGISGVEVSIYYRQVPLLNIFYVYLYFISVPFIFFICLLARRGVIRLQKKVADLIEAQMKQLFGMEVVLEPQKTSLFYKLFDLEIPLLKYLKRHIENLETDLKSYSQKVADQQKREVLMNVAAQMAHDIVTPISNLQTILQSDEAKENQELLLMELTQIKNLSEKLLREYRGEASIQKIKVEKIDVVSELKMVIESIKIFARKTKAVQIYFEYNHQEQFEILGERTQFIAAISNVLRNSVESLAAKDGMIKIYLNKNAESLKLIISDNGCGIKEENLTKVFENKVSIGKQNGTGLGLYQVKSTVEDMNGKIELESKLGAGTMLKLTFPVILSAQVVNASAISNFGSDIFVNPDLVLIDDKKANHVAWDIQARRVQKKLASFYSGQDFLTAASDFDKNTPIFVDYLFENESSSGKEIAEQIILMGFKNVRIATGLPPDRVDKPIGIKSVVGKEFPSIEFL